MSGRKTVLIVDDDPGILRVMSDGLSNALDLFDVVTASNGLEAVQELERRSVDVLVTDLAMPVMDGFALIAYVTNQRSTLPVVVLSGMVGPMLDQRLAGYGGLRVLRKPASYQEVAACVLEEIERVDRGLIEGIPLSGVLQLIEAERRSCKVVVTSGRRRGELDFESGRLVNAFSDDFGAEGEAAAYDILGWTDTAIELAPLAANVRRLVHTPMQLLLVEVAAAQDRGHEADAGGPSTAQQDAMADAEVANPEPPDDTVGEEADAPDAATGGETPDAPGAAAVRDEADATPAAAIDEPEEGLDGSILLDEPVPSDAFEAPPELVNGSTDTESPAEPGGADGDTATPAVPPPPAAPVPPAASVRPPAVSASTGGGPDAHVSDMLAAIERLAHRAKTADDALAAVAVEIDAFREAQRRFDAANAQREQRRRDLERFRNEVAELAREILGRVDGLFDAMASDPAAGDLGEERPTT